jgi:hypothetical protein
LVKGQELGAERDELEGQKRKTFSEETEKRGTYSSGRIGWAAMSPRDREGKGE